MAGGQTARRVEPRYKKIYLDAPTMAFVNEANKPSRLVNMAVIHLKAHMKEVGERLHKKFDFDEIDAVVDMFCARVLPQHEVDYTYFETIDQARETIHAVNDSSLHCQTASWKKVFPILLKHSDLAELNCFLYLSKFRKVDLAPVVSVGKENGGITS